MGGLYVATVCKLPVLLSLDQRPSLPSKPISVRKFETTLSTELLLGSLPDLPCLGNQVPAIYASKSAGIKLYRSLLVCVCRYASNSTTCLSLHFWVADFTAMRFKREAVCRPFWCTCSDDWGRHPAVLLTRVARLASLCCAVCTEKGDGGLAVEGCHNDMVALQHWPELGPGGWLLALYMAPRSPCKKLPGLPYTEAEEW